MTEAIKKLPLSFTRLATFGVSETTKVLLPIALKSGAAVLTVSGCSGGNDEELARGGDIGTAEHGRRHETLSRFRVSQIKTLRQGNTDGA